MSASNTDASSSIRSQPIYGDKQAVAEMIGFKSTRSIDHLMAQGCPYLKLGPRRVRFDLAKVRAWLAVKFGKNQRLNDAR